MENNDNNTLQQEMWIVYSKMETVTNSIKLSKNKNYNFGFYIYDTFSLMSTLYDNINGNMAISL